MSNCFFASQIQWKYFTAMWSTLPKTTFLWVPQYLDLQLQPPPKSCMLLHPERQILKPSGAEAEGGAGTHLTICVSFFVPVFLLCSVVLLKTAQLMFPTPSQWEPSFFTGPFCCFQLLWYHEGSLCPISTLIFLSFVSNTKLVSKPYQHIRIFKGVIHMMGSGKSQGHNIVYMSEATKWPRMSKQESDCWAWSHQAEEAPAKSKTRSPISPLCLGLQWPVPQT